MKQTNKGKFKLGYILRTKSGFEFKVDNVYTVSIFNQIYYAGNGVNGNVGFITHIPEEDLELVNLNPNVNYEIIC